MDLKGKRVKREQNENSGFACECRTRIARRKRIFEPCGLCCLRFLLEGLINIR